MSRIGQSVEIESRLVTAQGGAQVGGDGGGVMATDVAFLLRVMKTF